jgi:hypothetical protein
MYQEYPWVVVAPVLGLTITVLGHFVLAWLTGGARAYHCVLQGFMLGGIATLGVSLYGLLWTSAGLSVIYVDGVAAGAMKHPDLPLSTILSFLVFNLVIFAALGFCYVNFVGLSIASLRIRILQELMAQPEGMRLETILKSYNPKVLIDNRIDRLTSGQQLMEKEGRFHTGRRGILWAARIMGFMKFIILGKRRRQ